MRLEEELRQERFANEFVKALLNVLFTADWISGEANATLKPYGISKEQYNVLRILRGRHPKPATLQWITERMISKSSNATRLVEKLRTKGLADRSVCATNRRKVDITITPAGLDLLDELDPLLHARNEAMRHLTDDEARDLNRLLDKLRG